MRHEEAKAALVNRGTKVDAVAEEIEGSLTLLGATAIEDKLQEVGSFPPSARLSAQCKRCQEIRHPNREPDTHPTQSIRNGKGATGGQGGCLTDNFRRQCGIVGGTEGSSGVVMHWNLSSPDL